jgi:polyhydroxybutyrate depolymerase
MHRSTAVARALTVTAVLLSLLGAGAITDAASAAVPTWVRKPCTPTPLPNPLKAGSYCRNVVVDGYAREYWLYVPTKVANRPATSVPIVVMHHGSSGNGQQFLNISGWREEANQQGFVAAFPTGLQYFVTSDGAGRGNTKWNDFGLIDDIDVTRRLPGYPATAPWPADDIGFENRLLDDAATVVKIDSHRVFVSGFSNGSGFATRVALTMPTRVAAVGSSGGGFIVDPRDFPAGTVPADDWLMVGSLDDRIFKATGLTEIPLDPNAILANTFLRATMYTHARAWGLPTTACSVDRTATTTTFNYCAAGKPEFHFTVVKGLTHSYPHGYNATTNPSGLVATDVFWPFFAAHPLP